MLKRLSLQNFEPFTEFDVEFGRRLNLLCGDNGLGKTFCLEVVYRVLTGEWPTHPAAVRVHDDQLPVIEADGFSETEHERYTFVPGAQDWDHEGEIKPPQLIYMRADGGFTIWDRYRNTGRARRDVRGNLLGMEQRIALSVDEVWNGLRGEDERPRCNGLLSDWLTWEARRPDLFQRFVRVLRHLSPKGEVLQPGTPRRLSVEDARDIPTLRLPYGEVPVTLASAAMRRILSLAYVLLWTWHEHVEIAKLLGAPPITNLVLIVDEVEAHLHPLWQRLIVPAIFKAIPELDDRIQLQVLASTHAPLVLASVETMFDPENDRLTHFGLVDGKIVVEPIPWAKQGDAENWLTSRIFGLDQARSVEAERAIDAAEAFLRGEPRSDLFDEKAIDAELHRVLAGDDEFWPRWPLARLPAAEE